ncbi:Rv1733c family protein [Amycolatopsis pithecellobii]|uniref:Transmembrane protein n=1 Tax=Amycolatopsis pithecellobii TaxID=664692 RepID=A0A6N7YNN4_9PSEU|nr:hypothetical protein [Amycolatopsis pithecellobii]MTD54595.1 hypothetical protein [Amycolatopsis pithecellobii]
MNGQRWWRLAQLGRNPLVRSVDRLENALLVLAVLLIVLAVPFAWALGSHTYQAQRAVADSAVAERHPATAVLLADAPPQIVTPQGVPTNSLAAAEATWWLPDGTERTGLAPTDRGAAKGTRVPIWLDRAGNAVAPPPQPGDALTVGVSTGVVTWLGFAALAGGAFGVARALLDRRRRQQWEREWMALRIGHSHS